MRQTRVSISELFLVAGTRVLLGIGVGLLIADRVARRRRLAVGGTLLGIGAVSTIPLAVVLFGKRRRITGPKNGHTRDVATSAGGELH